MNYIEECLKQAKIALKKNEVPIGAIIIHNGKIIAKAHNIREHSQNALHHAEILAINKACKKLHSWRLNECEMYVSLEPCPMCAGAILNSRLKKLHILCKDHEHGAVLSKYTLLDDGVLNHKTEIEYIETPEAKSILQNFFSTLRKK